MPNLSSDLTILGGGSAGYAAARTATNSGLQTTVIDGSQTLGGLCILRGCMPSKTLIESANRFLTLRRAPEFGLRAENIQAHPVEIRDRKRRLIGEFADYRQQQLEDGDFDLIRGSARFLDPHSIEITPLNGDSPIHLETKSALVATGSLIPEFPLPGLADAGFLTSDDALESHTLPDSLIVLGGGAIAIELTHYFSALDVEVTVIQRSPRILKELDSDITNALTHAMTDRGIKVICDTKLEKVTSTESSKTVHFLHQGKERSATASQILVALGRQPATANIQLDQAGVELKGPYIKTNLTQATSAPHIFAAGDVCGPHEIVHLAIEQGETAATNAAVLLGKLSREKLRSMDYRLKLLGIFSHPEVATVGLTEIEAAAANISISVASYPFDDHGKSIVMGETEGFVKLIADNSSGEIVGAAAVGPHAVDLLHEIVVAMSFHSSPGQLAAIPHYHPTLSEIWTYPAEELAEKLS